MKKVLSAFLTALLITFTLICTPVSLAADDNLTFAVASDMHIETLYESLPVNYPESELYFHGGGSGNLYYEGTGITLSFLEKAKEQDVDFVLIPGDMTRNGTAEQHKYCAKLFESFESQTGIQVYLIPGNHDYFNCVPSEFKEFYSELCYKDALTVDTETASYTADLPNGYRLIAVDSNDPGNDGDGLNTSTFWIKEQVATAKADGKKIIYTMHHPLLEHLPLGSVLMSDFIVNDYKDVAEMFCDIGISYVFSGHEHGNDIAEYTGKNGNTVYDILTTALTSYPLEYRLVEFTSESVDISMQSIDECDFSRLIDGYNDAQLALMRSDYNAYSYGLFRYSIEQKILRYTSPEFLKKKLKVDDGLLANELDELLGLVNDTLDMPLYDNGDGELSLEKLAASKGVSFPKSDYTTLTDLVTALVAVHYYGDENMPGSETPECELLIKGLNTGLEFILSNAGKEAVKALVNSSDELFGGYSESLKPWIIAVADGDNSYEVAEAVLFPILDKFLIDDGPADRNVSLPVVSETVTTSERVLTFFEKLWNIIKYILNIVIATVK